MKPKQWTLEKKDFRGAVALHLEWYYRHYLLHMDKTVKHYEDRGEVEVLEFVPFIRHMKKKSWSFERALICSWFGLEDQPWTHSTAHYVKVMWGLTEFTILDHPQSLAVAYIKANGRLI
jgi:hypothetical protein